jgi:hypothetical protein
MIKMLKIGPVLWLVSKTPAMGEEDIRRMAAPGQAGENVSQTSSQSISREWRYRSVILCQRQ